MARLPRWNGGPGFAGENITAVELMAKPGPHGKGHLTFQSKSHNASQPKGPRVEEKGGWIEYE